MHKDVRQLCKRLRKMGLEVGEDRSHVAVRRQGRLLVTLPSTPSDCRWRQNAFADLRRAGVEIR